MISCQDFVPIWVRTFFFKFFFTFRILSHLKLNFSNSGMSNVVQRAATHIARKAADMDIVAGKSPISVAAAAIYMASQVTLFDPFCFSKIANIHDERRRLISVTPTS